MWKKCNFSNQKRKPINRQLRVPTPATCDSRDRCTQFEKMQKWNQIFGFLILIILISCQYDPYAHKYTTTEPKESDLIGTYVFERQTVDYDITEFRDSLNNRIVIPKIEINSNGTYRVVNLPVFETFDPTYMGIITQTGEWKISTVGSIGDGNGDFKKHWGIHLLELPSEVQYAGLMNDESPYEIIFGFGDPDAGQAMIFKKE